MRVKFEKGCTPETIAEEFYKIMTEEFHLIGAVNIYIQSYDEDMKVERFDRYAQYVTYKPHDQEKKNYRAYEAEQRRKKMKVVSVG